MTQQRKVGREYLRVSSDRSGRQRSPEEQHQDNVRDADNAGIELASQYREPDAVSASRFGSKARAAFDALVSDLECGRFGADVLILWESSRGSRKVGEWVRLIEACEIAEVNIRVTTHGREYDPTNPRDRRSLLEDAVDSEYETGKMSLRIRRASAARAEAGMPHTRVKYGYTRRYDERTRVMISQEPDPEEAQVIEELFARLEQGHAFTAIANDYKNRGIRGRLGSLLSPQYLRKLATDKTYIGIRSYRGKEFNAVWPALISDEQFWNVQKIISKNKTDATRPSRAHYLLSRIAVCDVCDEPLTISTRFDDPRYQCKSGHVAILQEQLDEFVSESVIHYLANKGGADKNMTVDRMEELSIIRAEIARLSNDLDEVRKAKPSNLAEARMFAIADNNLSGQIASLEEKETSLSVPAALRDMIGTTEYVRRKWLDKRTLVATKRTVLRLILVPEALGQLRVEPAGRGRRLPAQERVYFLQR